MYDVKKAAVLGSGVMGAAIAAHLANAGISVTLLDIASTTLTDEEEKKGQTLTDITVRNRIVLKAKEQMQNAKAMLLYTPSNIDRITFGNFEDDLNQLADADWVIEVVVEKLAIKQQLFQRILPYLKKNTILSSNTSGISIHSLVEGLPDRIKENFLITHFFNPPRYMKLLEIVPSRYTNPDVYTYMVEFCEDKLGKGIVTAKDTPGFIANRIGVFSLALVINKMMKYDLSIEAVDELTGSHIGRPNTGTFRLLDIIGIDTMMSVADYQLQHVTNEAERNILRLPSFIKTMITKDYLGNKKKQGFYKKVDKDTLVINPQTLDYGAKNPVEFISLTAAKTQKTLPEKLKVLLQAEDNGGKFVWEVIKQTLLFAGGLIPEIADEPAAIDDGMKWGYNWEVGPFELWDMIGVKSSVSRMIAEGETIPPFVTELLAAGKDSFYDQNSACGNENKITATRLRRENSPVLTSSDASLIDMGDQIACFVLHSPNSSITDKVIDLLHKAIEETECNYKGMVIASTGKSFCVGANLPMILSYAQEKNWSALETLSANFQNMNMELKYCSKPIIVAPFGMTLGGGAEIAMHCSKIYAHAETYIGLVEAGVGLIPGAGGNKELLIHLTEGINDNPKIDLSPFVIKALDTITAGKVSTSGPDAQTIGYLKPSDIISMSLDLQLSKCKREVLALAQIYVPKNRNKQIRVGGESLYAMLQYLSYNKRRGGFISEYDELIAAKIAYVLCGGTAASDSFVDEQLLLDLEREAFVSLCGEPKTQERIAYMLKTRKPLKN